MWAEAARATDVAAAWLLTYLVHSTALVCAAWLVTRLARLQPATRDFLWRAALLGGLVTATGAVAAPPLRVTGSVRLEAGEVDVRRIERVAVGRGVREELEGTLAAREPIRWASASAAPELVSLDERLSAGCRDELRAGPAAPDPEAWIGRVQALCEQGPAWWSSALLGIWLAGAALGLVTLARGYGALRGLSRTLTEVDGRTHGLARDLVADRAVRMAASAELSAPCVLPGGTIGLPLRCEEELTDGELRAVLAHELAHVERRDVVWSGLLRLVSAVFWVQPLNRLALARAREATEEACDDWALARTGERFGLARSISRVASWVAGASSPGPLAVSMVGKGGGAITARVTRVLSGGGRADPRWKRFLLATLIALPVPLLPTSRVASAPRVAVFLQEQSVNGVLHPDGVASPDSIHARVVVARFTGS